MKFSCERCGKKYATAESPAPGKVYKLKCKACGHVIVVKPPATSPGLPAAGPRPPGEAPRPTPAPLPAAAASAGAEPTDATPTPTPPPTLTPPPLAARTPAPVNGAAEAAFAPTPPADGTTEIAVSALGATATFATLSDVAREAAPEPPGAPEPRGRDDEFRPPPGDTGYVDLFADGGDGHDAGGEPGAADADPFAGGLGAPAEDEEQDPFASVRAELDAASTSQRPPSASEPIAASKVPEIPRPAPHRDGARTPFLLIGAGVLVVIGILAFVLLRARPAPTPAPVRAPVASAAPAPAPQPPAQDVAAAPPGPPDPPPVEMKLDDLRPPADEPSPAERKEDRNRKRREPRPEPRPAAKVAAAPAPAAPEPPHREEAKVALPEETEGLSPETVQKVLASTRRAFDGCISSARSSDLKLDGRKVILRLTINNSGAVTYPTLDDVTLNGTEMGACLKSAARLMVFPKFSGDPLRVEVPLTLAER